MSALDDATCPLCLCVTCVCTLAVCEGCFVLGRFAAGGVCDACAKDRRVAELEALCAQALAEGLAVAEEEREYTGTANGIASANAEAVATLRPTHTHECNSRFVHGDGTWCICAETQPPHSLPEAVLLEHRLLRCVAALEAIRDAAAFRSDTFARDVGALARAAMGET